MTYSQRINVVRNDTRPRLVIDLTDAATGDPIDVSDAGTSVVVKTRILGSEMAKSVIPCVKLITPTNATPGAGGRVQAMWPAGGLDTAGRMEAEIEITFADGSIQTVYDRLLVQVRDDF